MAISSTVVAKLGGNVDYVALNGGNQKSFSVNLSAGTWLVEIGIYSDLYNASYLINGVISAYAIKGSGGTAIAVVSGGGDVTFSATNGQSGQGAGWLTGVAIKLS